MEEAQIHHHLGEKQGKSFKKNISFLVLGGLLAVSLLTVSLVGQRQDVRQRAQVATTTFLETFDGAPTTPTRYDNPRFEFIEGHMWTDKTDGPLVVNTAQHGPDCAKPGTGGTVRHSTSDYKDLIFQCRDHMMTHVNGGAAFIYMTPNHSLDLSSGNATIKWDLDTVSLSTRDWVSVFVQNWDTQQQKVIDEPIPGQQGNPRNAIQIEQGGVGPGFDSGSGAWHIDYYNANSQFHGIDMGCCGPSIYDVVAMSAETRITFQVDITNKRHVRLWLPQFNYTLVEGDLSETLNWSKAVVTFAHHSYSADKGANPFTGACCEVGDGEANTWHWDNLSLTPAIPFTIIKSDHRTSNDGDTFNFATPAPANSLIRFHAFSGDGNVKVSLNDGPLQNATRTSNFLFPEQSASFIINIPQGTTKARFVTTSGNCCEEVLNPTMFSLTSGTTPIPTNTPTPPSGQQFTVNLHGSNETPPNNSNAMGTANITLNTTNNTLSYNINYTGFVTSETGAHIHGFAAAGVGGAPALHVLPSGTTKTGTWTYTDAQEANILAGLTYINIHSSEFPNGEIRGQIVIPGTATPTNTPTPTRTPTPTPTRTPTPTTPPTITPTGTACTKTGDLNCDNQIGILDLSILLSNWNTTNAAADINKDGNVTILDLSILLSNWGL